MRKIASCLIGIALCLMSRSILWAQDNETKEIPACKFCGMNREEFAHSRMGHDMGGHGMSHDMTRMGPGSQMLLNPAFGDDIYHTHPANMWMVNYKFMHTAKRGLASGTESIAQNSVSPVGNKPFGYMMTPTNMTMDMQMLMVMYGVTDRLTLMAMGSYLGMKMDMLMNMGSGNRDDTPMHTNGIGDTELRGVYGFGKNFVASLGLSLPTGDTRQLIGMMGTTFRAPYDMQLGSGTFDLKPALTYSALSDDARWNWGAQGMYTYHISGGNDYSLGDGVKLTTWLQRAFGHASSWLRLAYSSTGKINGRDSEIQKLLTSSKSRPTPDADPQNYGGQELDVLLGASYVKGPFSFGLELGLPVYQYVNGLQLRSEWSLNFGIQAMF